MSLTSCIISSYWKDKDGYARKSYKGKSYQHHRLVYMQYHKCSESSMKGLVVMHLCDNRPCINPDHLRLGSQQENIQDMTNKKRQAVGVNHGSSKLTEADVIAIRGSSLTQKELAENYGVDSKTIMKVVRNQTWKHLL